MKIKQTLGLIGAGNMGTAILEGLLKKKIAAADGIWVCDKISEKADAFAKTWKARRAGSNAEAVKNTEIILLAVKPQDLFEAANEFRQAFRKSQILISILAGTPVEKIRQAAGPAPEIVRAMPNLGAKVGEAVTAIAGENENALRAAEQIFSGCGKTLRLEEKYFDLVTAVSGSGPAYFFLFMELLAKEGVENGLGAKEAELLAVQTAVGAALLAQSSGTPPAELRRMVTSKGGTTEAALKVFESGNFSALVKKAIQAAVQRGKELGG